MYKASTIDKTAIAAAIEHQDNLTKPAGSLGTLESISIRLAGIFGKVPETLSEKAILLFAADHGIAAHGVSAYPQEVTAQMLANFAGGGAAINVLAKHAGAEVIVCDIGSLASGDIPNVREIRIAAGTGDITEGPAMTRSQAEAAIEAGRNEAKILIDRGIKIIGLGDMGIGNTSVASAISAAVTGLSVQELCGFGTGIDEERLAQKQALILRALEVNLPDAGDGLDILSKVGGFEFAGQVGAIIAGAEEGIPVVIDGFISGAAALIANLIMPESSVFMFASHISAEPGHRSISKYLGLKAMLDLEMRLGEGTGAALAFLLIDAAIKIFHQMATFEKAKVDKRNL